MRRRRFSLLRVAILLIVVAGLAGLAHLAWNPGRDVRDGRHDRGENGLWLAHGWMGDDAWFEEHGREKSAYRSREALDGLAERLKRHGIKDVFPHLCPVEPGGKLPGIDDEATGRFLDALGDVRVWPWIGGPNDATRMDRPEWRSAFASSVRSLLEKHPRLAGVHVNIEPLRDGSPEFLATLEALRGALPPGRRLSVAAYPPPTRWQPVDDVHWSEPYFREVAKRCDHLAVMMYDTGLRWEKPYRQLMRDWTREVLAWSEGRPVLLGVPAYDDSGVPWHDPRVENLTNALAGVHAGLLSVGSPPDHYRGVAVYCDWEMTAEKWHVLQERFLR